MLIVLPMEGLQSIVMSMSVYVYVSICLCVCLSVRQDYLRNHARNIYQIFVHVAYGRGSVLLQRRCDTLCTSGFVDEIMFFSTMGRIAV